MIRCQERAIDSTIETVRGISHNVKRWQSGDMCLRCTAAGMLEAESKFRIGHTDLASLALAMQRDVSRQASRRPLPMSAHTTIATAAPELAATPA